MGERMKFSEFCGPDRDRHYYRFQNLGTLVDIMSIIPLDRKEIRKILEECINTLEVGD